MESGGRLPAGARNVRALHESDDRGDSRSRHPSATQKAQDSQPPDRDPLGKMALFSENRPQPALGTIIVECSACRRRTPVSPLELVRSAFPFSVHLPLLRRYHSFMRCPSCGRRTWVRVAWQP